VKYKLNKQEYNFEVKTSSLYTKQVETKRLVQ